MSDAFVHKTVLLRETVAQLEPAEGRVIVDGTLGGGGHSEALLEKGATVFGLDRDPRALTAARARLQPFGGRFQAVQGNYAELESLLEGQFPVDGVLLDLGVSSPQLDVAERGFSFQKEGPLDMRMSDTGETAAELIERLDDTDLANVIYEYGEEHFSRQIARALKAAQPQTTGQAVAAVEKAVPRKAWPKKIHVATKTFQGLRMAVNRELESLGTLLEALPRVLKVGGRVAIITFHSLEDRRVKEAFRDLEGRCICPPGMPVCACGVVGNFLVRTKKAVAASDEEVADNPRARSAHLRVAERVR